MNLQDSLKIKKMKQMASEILSSEFVDVVAGKGLFFNEGIIYDNRFSHITNDDDYPMVEQKIKSIVELINNNPYLVHKDLEHELWYMV